MPRYLGIDPGLSGALAIVETINGLPLLVDTIDMPSIGTGAKARVDVIAAAKWIGKHAPSAAYVERAQAFPGQGASSGFSYGRAVGALEAVVALCAIPMSWSRPRSGSVNYVSPVRTKKRPDRGHCSCFPRNTHCSRGKETTVAPRRR